MLIRCTCLDKDYFLKTLLVFFSKITAPQQVISVKKLSIIIFFKPCEFNVNLWTFQIYVAQKVQKPFKPYLRQIFRQHALF